MLHCVRSENNTIYLVFDDKKGMNLNDKTSYRVFDDKVEAMFYVKNGYQIPEFDLFFIPRNCKDFKIWKDRFMSRFYEDNRYPLDAPSGKY